MVAESSGEKSLDNVYSTTVVLEHNVTIYFMPALYMPIRRIPKPLATAFLLCYQEHQSSVTTPNTLA